ncbi:MAG: Ig-like domain-containing protein, partial [Planctomycetota bacterium]
MISSWSDDTGVPGDGITSDATITLTGGAESGATVRIMDGGTLLGLVTAGANGLWSITTTTLTDGSHSFRATATDAAGNQSGASSALVLTIDTTAPGAPVISSWSEDTGVPGDGITSDATITLTGSAEVGANVAIFDDTTLLGTVTAGVNGSWSYTTPVLSEGSHSFRATATDAAGNQSGASSALVLTIDTAAPAAPVISSWGDDTGVPGDGITSDATITLTGGAESGATVRIMDGGALFGLVTAGANGLWSFTTATLTDRSYSFRATATDAAGNQSVASSALVVMIDTAVPGAPVISSWGDDTGIKGDLLTSDSTIALTGRAESGSTVQVMDGQVVIGKVTVNAQGNWAFTTPPLSHGDHSITATAIDAAGNPSSPSAILALKVDTVAPAMPVITSWGDNTANPLDGITADTTIALSGEAEALSAVSIFNGEDLVATVTASASGQWSFTTAPLPDGQHSFTVKATDAAGNQSVASAVLAVTIDTVAPGSPVISTFGDDTGIQGDALTYDITITLSGSSEPGSTVFVFDGVNFLGTATANRDGAWSYTTTALADGVHVFSAKATDAAGNQSGSSQGFSVRIDSAAPAAPSTPTVSATLNAEGFWVEGVAEAGALVSVARGGNIIGSQQLASGQTAYSIPVPLAQETVNLLDVTATDAAGNVSTATRVTVTEVSSLPVIFTVTSESDADSGLYHRGTLRWAINQANASAGTDIIRFNIPGGGVRTITPATALPVLAGGITIDGYSQPGASANTANIDG